MRYLFILSFLFLAACAGMQRDLDHAPEGTQSIRMWHKPSGERIDVTYRIGGRYDAAAFREIDRFFRDRRSGDESAVDPALIDVIADLRDRMVMPQDTLIELTSGYRSPESNALTRNAARNSYHTKGQAADIRIPDMNARVLELVATTMQRGGVAFYPDSGHVHVDVGPIRGWEVKRGREESAAARPAAPARSPAVALTTRGDAPPPGKKALPGHKPSIVRTTTLKPVTTKPATMRALPPVPPKAWVKSAPPKMAKPPAKKTGKAKPSPKPKKAVKKPVSKKR